MTAWPGVSTVSFMTSLRVRNVIPPIYGVLVLAGFLISATVGVVVLIVGAMLSGLLWSTLSGRRARRG